MTKKRITNELDVFREVKEKIKAAKASGEFLALDGISDEIILYIDLEKKLEKGIADNEMFLVVDMLGTSRGAIACTKETNIIVYIFLKNKSGVKLYEITNVIQEVLEGLDENVTSGCLWSYSSEVSKHEDVEGTWFRFMQFNTRYEERVK